MSNPSYQTIGASDAPPLIFLHGLGAGSEQTISAFQSLPDTYLIAPDMPGHGVTQPEDTSHFSFDHFADITVELIKKLGYKSVNLGGLSMGSGIIINIALRYPECVNKLILLRPSWIHHKKPEHLKLVAWVGQWIEDFGPNLAREKLQERPEFIALMNQNPPVADSIMGLFQRPNTPASTSVLYKMWQDAPFDDLAQLTQITAPTLVLTTERDELHPQSTADRISEQIPNCQTVTLPPRYHEGAAYNEALQSEAVRFLAR